MFRISASCISRTLARYISDTFYDKRDIEHWKNARCCTCSAFFFAKGRTATKQFVKWLQNPHTGPIVVCIILNRQTGQKTKHFASKYIIELFWTKAFATIIQQQIFEHCSIWRKLTVFQIFQRATSITINSNYNPKSMNAL